MAAEIQSVVEGYGEGDAVFKEMMQNADDSKATISHFILDEKTYPLKNLINKEMEQFQGFFKKIECFPINLILLKNSFSFFLLLFFFQGPSFYVYNDQQFTKDDIYNISHFGSRGKKGDPTKIGLYGIGFSTIYGVTDFPVLMTGDYFYFFDPHRTLFNGQF